MRETETETDRQTKIYISVALGPILDSERNTVSA